MSERGPIVLRVARVAIGERLGVAAPATPDAPFLHEPGACFVTLRQQEDLRGCIGSLEPHRSLLADLRANARAAAFEDPRFPPLQREEFHTTTVEVSLLSPMTLLACPSEQEACELLRPDEDGVVLEYGRRRGTFLPQVWEQLPEPREFLANLKLKAGLPMDFWAADVRLYRYTVEKWCENDYSKV